MSLLPLPGLALVSLMASITLSQVVAPSPNDKVIEPLGDGTDPQCDDPAPVPGFLSVDSHPWTRVVIDEKMVGSTPLFKEPLSPGVHRLILLNDEVGLSVEREVVIESEKTRKLKLALAFKKTESELDALEDGQSQMPSDEDCLDDALEDGFLSLQTQPWSEIFVDGQKVGSTPLFRHSLRQGQHTIRYRFADGQVAFSRIEIKSGETVKMNLNQR